MIEPKEEIPSFCSDASSSSFIKKEPTPCARPFVHHRATYKNHSLTAFLDVLADNYKDLIIEELSEDSTMKDGVEHEIPSLYCTKCGTDVANRSALLNHFVTTHLNESDRYEYESIEMFKIESGRENAVSYLQDSFETQIKQCFVKRKFENENAVLKVHFNSPLASFVSLKNMKIYLDRAHIEKTNVEQKIVQIDLQQGDTSYQVDFDFAPVELNNQRVRIGREKRRLMKQEDKLAKFLSIDPTGELKVEPEIKSEMMEIKAEPIKSEPYSPRESTIQYNAEIKSEIKTEIKMEQE
ncbi:hypothetical protein L5515_019532 [Caenorhabditis briggsae]|uniref:C2H2-type domain-containing protein n=1 Tax=Caenorhabditis briggsae TaxID=6238 RepID=A0AAE9FKP1_CAEBR|nr:hypothetical protein L5515_019532 [Caenorhabditis briggsae]